MIEDKPKVVAAIQAAVSAYMDTEEQAIVVPASTGPGIWGLAGRQDIMAMRRLIAMRVRG